MCFMDKVIIAKDLSLSYSNNETIIKEVNFSITSGSFVFITGTSGSGKSTLMNLLGFLDTATSGSYKFEGKVLKSFDEDSLAEIRNKKIGFVFQQFHLLFVE